MCYHHLPPYRDDFFGGGKEKLSNAVNALCFEEKHESKCTKKTEL